MLKKVMEGSQIQGVIFESEEMGWAGAVGKAESWVQWAMSPISLIGEPVGRDFDRRMCIDEIHCAIYIPTHEFKIP
jgi:hypothetical protein